jgi:hypothetical protein
VATEAELLEHVADTLNYEPDAVLAGHIREQLEHLWELGLADLTYQ